MIFREYCELVVFVQLYTVQAMLALQNTFPGLGSKPVTNAPVFLEGGPTFRSSSRSRGLAHEECPKLIVGLRGSFASDMPVVNFRHDAASAGSSAPNARRRGDLACFLGNAPNAG